MTANRRAEIPAQYETGWLDQLDGRRNLSKQMRARFDEIASDLGGRSTLSYMQRSLIERLLWLEYWLSQQEQALAQGNDFDISRWTQATNAYQGIASKLGLQRKAREVPSLHDYLRNREGASA